MSAICALCKASGDLRNSHILPEWFYRLVYDPSPRRLRLLSTDAETPERFVQKGLREHLLCEACEQKLSRWENYAKKAFVDGRGVSVTPLGNGMRLQGLDYKKFKLFLLSLLWRMGVSTLPFFADVNLGPHEEKLRIALNNDNPLAPSEYSCVLVSVKLGGKFYPDWILDPSRAKWEGHTVYWLIITGILFVFFLGKDRAPAAFSPLILNDRNEMDIMISEVKNIPFLAEAVTKLSSARQVRKAN